MGKYGIDLVMFDLDGTLADTVPQISLAVKKTLEKNNIVFPGEDRIRLFVGNGVDALLRRSILNKIDVLEQEIDPVLFQKVRFDYFEIYQNEIGSNYTLYDGVEETLKSLKDFGYKLAIVTNKPDVYIKPWLHSANLSDFFDFTLGGGILKVKKPDPQVMLYVCEKVGVSHEHSIMVGDSVNDVLGAQKAGIRSIGLTYGYNYGKPIKYFKPDFVFDKFIEIKGLLVG